MSDIWLVRHGADATPVTKRTGLWRPESPLTSEGRAHIERVRHRYIVDITFDLCWHSGFMRARETAEILLPRAGWESIPGLGPVDIDNWESVLDELAVNDVTLRQIGKLRPSIMSKQQVGITRAIREAADRLDIFGSAILVSHQPLIGLARQAYQPGFDIYNEDIELPKGGIYILSFDKNGALIHLKELDTVE